jgi:nucleotide-binding universal stress UspA family protein
MSSILVQMADHEWTQRALHIACGLAREQKADVVLLRLMQVEHISYLGSEFGEAAFTHEEYTKIDLYAMIAEEYGVEVSIEQIQALSPLDAVVDAANTLDARVIFARVLPSAIPFLHTLRMHHLERRLRGSGRQLFTLDESDNPATKSMWGQMSSAAQH